MLNQFSRTQLLLGAEAMEKLKGAHVAVFGIGGVGGYVCEALVRSGVGAFDLVDDDKVCLTNLNRQIIATRKTVGKYKVEVMRDRILEINPDCDVRVHQCFYLPETADQFDFSTYDYVGGRCTPHVWRHRPMLFRFVTSFRFPKPFPHPPVRWHPPPHPFHPHRRLLKRNRPDRRCRNR